MKTTITLGFQVMLVVGNQSFPVGVEWDTREEAEWYEDQLRTALRLPPMMRLPANPPRPWSPCSGPDCEHPSH